MWTADAVPEEYTKMKKTKTKENLKGIKYSLKAKTKTHFLRYLDKVCVFKYTIRYYANIVMNCMIII